MIQIESINVCFNTGEHMTINTNEVMLYAKGGELIGHAVIEEYHGFLRDILADVRLAHSMGEDERPN